MGFLHHSLVRKKKYLDKKFFCLSGKCLVRLFLGQRFRKSVCLAFPPWAKRSKMTFPGLNNFLWDYMYPWVVRPEKNFDGPEKIFYSISCEIWRKFSLFREFGKTRKHPKPWFWAYIVERKILHNMEKKNFWALLGNKKYSRNGTSKWGFSGRF